MGGTNLPNVTSKIPEMAKKAIFWRGSRGAPPAAGELLLIL